MNCGKCLFYKSGACDLGMKRNPLPEDGCHRYAARPEYRLRVMDAEEPTSGWGDTYDPIRRPVGCDGEVREAERLIERVAVATGVSASAIARRISGRPPKHVAATFDARTIAAVWMREAGIRLDVIAFVLQVSNLRFVFNRSRVARARERFGVDVWEAPRRQRGRPPKSLSSSATPPPLDADGRSQTARS